MDHFQKIRQDFLDLRCCVIIPTYNNDRYLERVIDKTREYTDHIIVINDGSTDRTAILLDGLKEVDVIEFSHNRGKGYALRKGFMHARQNGFKYAITIDSDGQHLPEDIPGFISKIKEEPGSLIVGARNMDQTDVPGKSNFGHKFSNFWFKVETGISLPDTQSGYRLYPLEPLGNMKFVTRRYEFETEVLVRAAWKGIPVTYVPVRVIYQKSGDRVSHFRPFIDFTRVSILNSILVLLAFLWFRPIMFLRTLTWKRIREFVRRDLIMSRDTNIKLSASVAFGIFMGLLPIWGWQMLTAVFLAALLRLNKIIVLVAANISLPPMIPLIIYFSFVTGSWVTGGSASLSYSDGISFETIRNDFLQYAVGAVVLGVIAGLVSGLITYILLTIFRKKRGDDKVRD
ncbi:MAG: DUF2062 domain-containing protein [Bacteroidales bacterium]